MCHLSTKRDIQLARVTLVETRLALFVAPLAVFMFQTLTEVNAAHLGQASHGVVRVTVVMEQGLVAGMLVVNIVYLLMTIAVTFVDSIAVVDVTAATTIILMVATGHLGLVILEPLLLLVQQEVSVEA